MTAQLRLLIHDYAGHPFQLQLSRRLAAEPGFTVAHLFSTDTVSGKGSTSLRDDDPSTLTIEGIRPARRYERYSPVGRVRFELSYGTELVRRIAELRPDCVVLCNTPLFVLGRVTRRLAAMRIPWVQWHQDIVSLAVSDELRRRSAVLGKILVPAIEGIERRALARAAHAVPINEFFVERYRGWHLDALPTTVIANWAPLDELQPEPRDNDWGRAHWPGSPDALRLLYSGTLGRKHNPRLLVDVLTGLRGRGVEASMVVVSEGDGADDLRAIAETRDDLTVLPYQPMSALAQVIGSCDLALGLLEADASRYSVPSKVLSYLACGRTVCLLAPESNPAAQTVLASGGAVFAPDARGAARAAERCAQWAADRDGLAESGRAARAYAEQHFAVGSVVARFADIVRSAVGARGSA